MTLRMDIPKAEEFEALSKRLGYRRRRSLDVSRALCREQMLGEHSRGEAACREFLEKVVLAQELDREAAKKLYAYQWMASNPSFSHLLKCLKRGREQKTHERWCIEEAARVASELANRPSKTRRQWIWNRLAHLDCGPAWKWLAGVSESLSIYFYGTPHLRAVPVREKAAHLKLVGRKISDAIAELEAFAATETFAGAELRSRAGPLMKWVRMQQERMETAVGCIPVERADETARERWLMYDLSRVFLESFRREKPAAIAHVLSFAGIASRASDRSIEKQISKWRDQRAKRAAVNRRYEKGNNY